MPDHVDEVRQKMFAAPCSQVRDGLDGAAVLCKSQALSNGKVGIIGFCSGGGLLVTVTEIAGNSVSQAPGR